MKNLQDIKPGKLVQDASAGIPELLQYFLSRIQFVPNTRFSIGWRGMKPSERMQSAWTFKINGFKGIYGLHFNNATESDDWLSGTFGISYFPHPDEDLVERFSMGAVWYTQQANYFDTIRDFIAHPEMATLFRIGEFSLSINNDETALMLSMKALSRHKIETIDGMPIPGESSSRYIIEPGGMDQNLPSFVIAYGLFKTLASTVTFSLQQPPDYLRREKIQGRTFAYRQSGYSVSLPEKTISEIELVLGYGQADFQQITKPSELHSKYRKSLTWKSGEKHPEFCKNAFWWVAHKIDDLQSYDKTLIGIEDRPQLLVISGFLGSGKTSLLQHFLEHQVQRDRFVAVLQNEIGETGLDGKLLDDSYSITELNEGTVCCTLAGELRPAISNIIKRFQPDMIVLETSGATNPIGLRDDFLPLSEMVRFDSITTVVDASNFFDAVDNYEVAVDQIKAADLIVLNKTDRVDKQRLEQISKQIRLLNPDASVHPTTQGYINPGLIYDFDVTRSSKETSPEYKHHRHTHDGISSVKINMKRPVDIEDLVNQIESMPPSVFRLKGIVDTAAEQSVLVQYVSGHYDISNFQNPSVSDRFLVLIGHELESTARSFEAIA